MYIYLLLVINQKQSIRLFSYLFYFFIFYFCVWICFLFFVTKNNANKLEKCWDFLYIILRKKRDTKEKKKTEMKTNNKAKQSKNRKKSKPCKLISKSADNNCCIIRKFFSEAYCNRMILDKCGDPCESRANSKFVQSCFNAFEIVTEFLQSIFPISINSIFLFWHI